VDKTLKSKTISGLLWSFIDKIAGSGITFVVGIILARLLSPKEFGLIGMITIFIAISESFIDSGFSQALIRKKDCTQRDYSTVFFFNLAIGVLFFLILFLLAPAISNFFDEPKLKMLVRVLGLVLIIDAFTIIQRTTLTKRVDFKLQTKVSIISSLCSGIIGITMAYMGYGVWSLVAKTLCQRFINSLLLWFWNYWKPQLVFCINSFRELFSFGSKLLISGLINTIYQNIYFLIIGKYFSAQELGFYTRAVQFKDLPSSNINGIISRVSYPVLAQLQDDPTKLKAGYKKLIKSTMFITFVLMLLMAAVAEPMIITLIGEKWRVSIEYLQLLCFVGMLYPLHALNLNMLNVKGRSDLFLKLEIIKKIFAIPTIIIGIYFGIKIMIIGMLFNSLFAYYLNSYWSGKLINYPIREQIADILPSFLLALGVAIAVFFIGWLLPAGYFVILIIQVITGGVLVISVSEFLHFDSYFEMKDIITSQYKKLRNGRK
jgi:O-antigen/teichoic acid export membrane protein